MTLHELKESTAAVVTPAEIAPILKCDAQYIRLTAREHPERLGFPVSVVGKRVKIPRIPFIHYIEGAEN